MKFRPVVKKDVLLGILGENRDEHRRRYEKSVETFSERVVSECERLRDELDSTAYTLHWNLKEKLKDMKTEELVDYLSSHRPTVGKEVRIDIPAPFEQLSEYEMAIAAISADVSDNVELSPEDFAAWMQDQWWWSENFDKACPPLDSYPEAPVEDPEANEENVEGAIDF